MKRIISILYIIAGLFLFPAVMAIGQTTEPVSFSSLSATEIIREHIFLFTDRALYAVNENILFKIDYQIENNQQKLPWSTVIYVELIRQDGRPLVQRKYPLTVKGAQGNMLIPEDVPSGIYYLKAYTKWMRNFPPETYEYKPIRIINPYTCKTESYSVREDSVHSDNFIPITCDTAFNCSSGKKKYKTREKVTSRAKRSLSR